MSEKSSSLVSSRVRSAHQAKGENKRQVLAREAPRQFNSGVRYLETLSGQFMSPMLLGFESSRRPCLVKVWQVHHQIRWHFSVGGSSRCLISRERERDLNRTKCTGAGSHLLYNLHLGF